MTTHVAHPHREAEEEAAASAPRSAAGSSARTRAAFVGLAAIALAAVLVFWLFDALPFMDLPAHAGLIAMRHRFADSAFEQRYFVLAPHIGPYSLFRFLGEALVGWIGAVGAVRALSTLPVVALPLAFMYARKHLFNEVSPTYGFLGIALSFGLMTLLGFASYLLGVAIMLFGLTMWLDLLVATDDRAPEARRREIMIALFAPVMFVAHGHAFVLFLICAGVSTIVTGRRFARILRLRALIPALALAGWVAWIERDSTTPAGSVPVVPKLVPYFQSATEKIQLLVTPMFMTRSGIDFTLAIVVWAFAIACTLMTVRSLRTPKGATAPRDVRHARALYASALILALVFAALPHAVGWFGFVDGRLVPVFLFLALLGIRRQAISRTLERVLDKGAPVTAAAITALALAASYRFQSEATGFREVLAKVPANSSLLNLPLDPNSDVFSAHPFIHYDKLVLAERPIVVSDVWFHQGSALYPTAQNPALRLPASYSESDLKFIDWPAYHLEDWDYVLIRTRPNAEQPWTPSSLALEEHRGGWWLFKQRASLSRK